MTLRTFWITGFISLSNWGPYPLAELALARQNPTPPIHQLSFLLQDIQQATETLLETDQEDSPSNLLSPTQQWAQQARQSALEAQAALQKATQSKEPAAHRYQAQASQWAQKAEKEVILAFQEMVKEALSQTQQAFQTYKSKLPRTIRIQVLNLLKQAQLASQKVPLSPRFSAAKAASAAALKPLSQAQQLINPPSEMLLPPPLPPPLPSQ